jgi:hypothetical protein
MRSCLRYLLSLVFCFAASGLYADGPAFDLAGPKVDVHVKRGEVTLPISQTPNLLPGDRLWIHPDLPASQSEHFVLVVAFLRGSTNPPPPEWFTRVETWSREAREEGVFVTVPDEAQQALIFLAPETGGDFNTLRGAVRSRPGAFVRAAQDLQAASWERMRLDSYLDNVKATSRTDPKSLKDRAELAARSLGIRINQDCFNRPFDQQGTCLAQNSEGLVLDDANSQTLVDQLTSGSTADLMNQLSYSTMGGAGAYSPYVGAVVDTARILASLRTPHFQYIPALALPTADTMNLRLNVPPSFRNPKSVVVVALPPLGPARPEPLQPVTPADSFCVYNPALVLPSEGGPLIFATDLDHDLILHLEPAEGQKMTPLDVPVKAEPGLGGLVLQTKAPSLPGGAFNAVVKGKWGFDDWEGPEFHLVAADPGKWTLAPTDDSALVVGRDDTLHFAGQSSLCVNKVEEVAGSGHADALAWKSPKPDLLEVSLPLKEAMPGPVNVAIYQFGLAHPDEVKMTAYEAAASLDRLTLSSGDKTAYLKGTRLDEVAGARIGNIVLTPSTLSRADDQDRLQLNAVDSTSSLTPGKDYTARVELKDGRELKAPVVVNPPRPEITLLSKGVQEPAAGTTPSPVEFSSSDDLPVNGRVVFFLKSNSPDEFPRDEHVEVAAADSSFHATLGVSDGSLMLEDARTAVASLDPLARFGSSAFGPIRVRAIAADGAASDWLQLGTLVRTPDFKELRCPRSLAKPCVLSGDNLFLADSLAATVDFANSTDVPPDFTGTQLIVPHPTGGILYVKLRDDPATVQTLTLPVTPIVPATETAAARAHAPLPAAAAGKTPSDESGGSGTGSTENGSGQAAPGNGPSAPPQPGNAPEDTAPASPPAKSPQGAAQPPSPEPAPQSGGSLKPEPASSRP